MTDRALKKLNALKQKRDDVKALQATVGRQLQWADGEDADKPTPDSCRSFISVAIGNAQSGVITDETYRKMWALIEADIGAAVKRAERDYEA